MLIFKFLNSILFFDSNFFFILSHLKWFGTCLQKTVFLPVGTGISFTVRRRFLFRKLHFFKFRKVGVHFLHFIRPVELFDLGAHLGSRLECFLFDLRTQRRRRVDQRPRVGDVLARRRSGCDFFRFF